MIFGCDKRITQNENEGNLLETPETLENDKNVFSISKYSSRYNSNIIEKLYEEALDKNEHLKNLHKKINLIKNDSLDLKAKPYKNYSKTNNNYFENAYNYSSNIKDSITKKLMIDVFKRLESNYRKSVSKHENKMIELDKKASILNDQLILMKLVLTEPMMSNYQRNELPEIKTLESMINDYNKLIRETKEYTKLRK